MLNFEKFEKAIQAYRYFNLILVQIDVDVLKESIQNDQLEIPALLPLLAYRKSFSDYQFIWTKDNVNFYLLKQIGFVNNPRGKEFLVHFERPARDYGFAAIFSSNLQKEPEVMIVEGPVSFDSLKYEKNIKATFNPLSETEKKGLITTFTNNHFSLSIYPDFTHTTIYDSVQRLYLNLESNFIRAIEQQTNPNPEDDEPLRNVKLFLEKNEGSEFFKSFERKKEKDEQEKDTDLNKTCCFQ